MYKWRKEFLIFSLKLNRLWNKDHLGQCLDQGPHLDNAPAFLRERPPHQSELRHDFLVTINFLPRLRVFLEEF